MNWYEIKNKSSEKNYPLINFCMRAIGANDTRYVLRYIKIENGIAKGTDGHRLHIAKGVDMDDGLFLPLRMKQSIFLLPDQDNAISKFPDTEKIAPKITDEKSRTIRCDNPDLFAAKLSIKLKQLSNSFIDSRFLRQLYMSGLTWKFYKSEELSPVLFESGEYSAVIMPMRIAWEDD